MAARVNSRIIDDVLRVASTGDPWRTLFERLGNLNSAWRQLSCWVRKGEWKRVFETS